MSHSFKQLFITAIMSCLCMIPVFAGTGDVSMNMMAKPRGAMEMGISETVILDIDHAKHSSSGILSEFRENDEKNTLDVSGTFYMFVRTTEPYWTIKLEAYPVSYKNPHSDGNGVPVNPPSYSMTLDGNPVCFGNDGVYEFEAATGMVDLNTSVYVKIMRDGKLSDQVFTEEDKKNTRTLKITVHLPLEYPERFGYESSGKLVMEYTGY